MDEEELQRVLQALSQGQPADATKVAREGGPSPRPSATDIGRGIRDFFSPGQSLEAIQPKPPTEDTIGPIPFSVLQMIPHGVRDKLTRAGETAKGFIPEPVQRVLDSAGELHPADAAGGPLFTGRLARSVSSFVNKRLGSSFERLKAGDKAGFEGLDQFFESLPAEELGKIRKSLIEEFGPVGSKETPDIDTATGWLLQLKLEQSTFVKSYSDQVADLGSGASANYLKKVFSPDELGEFFRNPMTDIKGGISLSDVDRLGELFTRAGRESRTIFKAIQEAQGTTPPAGPTGPKLVR